MNLKIDTKDTLVMKLLHYFITEKNYNPIILHGVQNEIWLENMTGDYKIIRIVFEYIHNDEQLGFDMFKTKRIVKDIKRKTFKFKMNVLSIFTDLGDSVNLKSDDNIDCIYLKNEKDLKKYNFLYEYFPDIDENMKYEEKGLNLFLKLSDDINEKSKKDAEKANKIFTPKKPIFTKIIIAINVLVFLFALLFNGSSFLINNFSVYGPLIRHGEIYRLLTGTFVHIDFFHLLFNMYSLYVIGSQIEGFFGRTKFLIIYFLSAIMASLFSILLNSNVASIGASGAIFGLLGAMLYFGYYYRVYLGNTLTSQIVPIILINLLMGFLLSGIDNFAHIGGLVGGIVTTMALGIDEKSDKNSKINGVIFAIIIFAFLIFMNFIYPR